MSIIEIPRGDGPHVLHVFTSLPPPGALRYNFTIPLSMPLRNLIREILKIREINEVYQITKIVSVYKRMKRRKDEDTETALWYESQRRRKLRHEIFPDELLDEGDLTN